MNKKTWTGLAAAMLCLLLLLPAAEATETREGVIVLEGMEETFEEALFESPYDFSFWYATDRLEAYTGNYGISEGAMVTALYSDDYMFLSMIPEEDAEEYAQDLGITDLAERSADFRVSVDVYRELEDGQYVFLTLIAEDGQYLSAVGQYAEEAAEGNARFFQRVLDSVMFTAGTYDTAMLKIIPGTWTEDFDGIGTVLTLEEDGEMSLVFSGVDGGKAYSYSGAWGFELAPNYSGRLMLEFTSTDNPSYDPDDYYVECEYKVYTESWLENDSEFTALIFEWGNCSDVSPFEDVYGDNSVALFKERGPNMRVVNCKEFVSLRATRSTSSKRLLKVPLGALVLAYPEFGEENGFIRCVYQDEEGYILAEYLQPIEE